MAGGKASSSAFAVFLVDGYSMLAAKVQSATHLIKALFQDTTGLGDTFQFKAPTGLQTATLAQTGAFFDDAVNGIHTALTAVAQTVSRLVVLAPVGNIFGAEFVGFQGTYGMTYGVLGTVGQLTKADVVYQVSGAIDRGMIVQTWTQKSVTWNTKTDGNSIDYNTDRSLRPINITAVSVANPSQLTTGAAHGLTTGQVILVSGTNCTPSIAGPQTVTVVDATRFTIPVNVTVVTAGTGSLTPLSTVNGGVGYQAISEFTGPTSFVGKIRHSVDDTVYVDLVTFTSVAAAPATERIVVAAGTTINRYLCFTGTLVGTSITPFCGFARN
jgi:hypothetical protein